MAEDVRFDIRARDRSREAFDSVTRSLGGLQRGLGTVKAAISATLVATGATALATMEKRAIETADAIGKMADKVGVTTGTLQEYRYAMELSGVAQEKADASLEAFTRNLGKAQAGTGELTEFLRKSDQAFLDQVKSARSTDDALDLVLRRLASMTSAQQRAALASAAFGDAGVSLTNVVRGGADAYDAMREEARKLGLVIEDSLIRNAEDANDQLTRMEKVLSTNVTRALLGLAPAITAVGTAAAQAAPAVSDFVTSLLPRDLAPVAELQKRLDEVTDKIIDYEESLNGIAGMIPGNSAVIENRLRSLRLEARALEDLIEKRKAAEAALNDSNGGEGEGGAPAKKLPKGIDLNALRKPIPPDVLEAQKFIDEQLDREIQETTRSLEQMREEGKRLGEAVDPARAYAAEMERLDQLLHAGAIDQQVYGLAAERAQKNLQDATHKSSEAARDLGLTFSSALEDAIVKGEKMSDVLRGLAEDVTRIFVRRSVTEPLANAAGGLFDSLFDALPGFAAGTDFTVGGAGGVDRQLVAFRATPGERVRVDPAGRGRDAALTINQYVDARGAENGVEERIRAVLAAERPRLISQAVAQSLGAVEASANMGGKLAKAVGRR